MKGNRYQVDQNTQVGRLVQSLKTNQILTGFLGESAYRGAVGCDWSLPASGSGPLSKPWACVASDGFAFCFVFT